MKKWKEAASVILAAGTPSVPSLTGINCKQWEDLGKEKPDFQILALKKSRESPFTPGAYVFPGGKVNKSDSCAEWSNIFSNFGYKVDKLCQLLKNDRTNLPIFEDKETLPRCITLRITAIREAFEESGVLICKRTPAPASNSLDIEDGLCKGEHLTIKEPMAWRKKIMNNHNEFLNLCKEYNCYPDVRSLYLWSNWLTPTNVPMRFDSVFFIAVMESAVTPVPENYEIEIAKWFYPQDLLRECYYQKNESYLPPPQFYELSRLGTVESISHLSKFMVTLNKMPNEQWMPVRGYAKDGEFSLLPGDDMYPKDVDFVEHQVILNEDCTIKSLRGLHLHRFEHKDVSSKMTNGIPRYNRLVLANLLPSKLKHLQPWHPAFGYLKGHL